MPKPSEMVLGSPLLIVSIKLISVIFENAVKCAETVSGVKIPTEVKGNTTMYMASALGGLLPPEVTYIMLGKSLERDSNYKALFKKAGINMDMGQKIVLE